MNRPGITVALLVSLAAACATTPEPVEPEEAEEIEEISDVATCLEVPLQQEELALQPVASLDREPFLRAVRARQGRTQCCYEHLLARSEETVSGVVRLLYELRGNRVAEVTLSATDAGPLVAEWDEPFQACLTAIHSDMVIEGWESLADDQATSIAMPLSFSLADGADL